MKQPRYFYITLIALSLMLSAGSSGGGGGSSDNDTNESAIANTSSVESLKAKTPIKPFVKSVSIKPNRYDKAVTVKQTKIKPNSRLEPINAYSNMKTYKNGSNFVNK